jgi:hypothetical protein
VSIVIFTNFLLKFFRVADQKHVLAEAKNKALIFKERFKIIYQRILRNEAFTSAGNADDFCSVSLGF